MRGHFNAIAYRDVLFSMILGLVILMGIIILTISIKATQQTEGSPPPGTMEVMIQWTNGPIDVDLWAFSVGEERPVGFSRTSGRVWSLNRDDLGTSNDDPAMPLNYENSYARTALPGRYTFNVLCYKCDTFPVKVRLEVRVTNMGGLTGSHVLYSTTVELTRPLQEVTVVSFDLSKEGTVTRGSLNNVLKPLAREWK